MANSLLGLVQDGARVGVDEDVFVLGSKSLVEVGLAVELDVGRHVCFDVRDMCKEILVALKRIAICSCTLRR